MTTHYRDDRERFVSREELTEVGEDAKLTDVLREVAARTTNGIVIRDAGERALFIDATKLAKQALCAPEKNAEMPIGAFLRTPGVEPRKLSTTVADISVAPVGELAKLDDEAQRGVFYEVVDDGDVIGYLVPDKTLAQEIRTESPKYICTGPGKHLNSVLGDGTCTDCPYPLGEPEP